MNLEARSSVSGNNVIVDPETDVNYSFGRELEPGDFIEVSGIYSVDTNFYYVKILGSEPGTVLGVSPRRRRKQTGTF